MRYCAGLMAFVMMLFAGMAHAEIEDDAYIDQYFGTVAFITVAERPYDLNTGYWTEILPDQIYDSSYVSGMVNAIRMAAGFPVMLDPQSYPVEPYMEQELPEGFRYQFNFKGLRPSEVEMVLSSFGGLEQLLPGASISFEPLRSASLYFDAYDSDSLDCTVAGMELHIDMDTPPSQVQRMLLEGLRQRYDEDVIVDVYLGYNIASYSKGINLTVTVSLGDEGMMSGGPDF